jgi:hypothetical protein
MGRVQCHIRRTVYGHTTKNKKEGVGDKGSGRLAKAERASQNASKNALRNVVSDSQATSNTNNMLGASAPEWFGNLTSDELIQVPIIHLLETASTEAQEEKDKRYKLSETDIARINTAHLMQQRKILAPKLTFWVGCWIKLDRKSANMYVPNVVATAAASPPAATSSVAEVDLALLTTFFERPRMEVADLENNMLDDGRLVFVCNFC